MKAAIIKATYRVFQDGGRTFLGEQSIVKTYQGVNDEDLNNQITYEINKNGYIHVEPLTNKQYEELLEQYNESNTQI